MMSCIFRIFLYFFKNRISIFLPIFISKAEMHGMVIRKLSAIEHVPCLKSMHLVYTLYATQFLRSASCSNSSDHFGSSNKKKKGEEGKRKVCTFLIVLYIIRIIIIGLVPQFHRKRRNSCFKHPHRNSSSGLDHCLI